MRVRGEGGRTLGEKSRVRGEKDGSYHCAFRIGEEEREQGGESRFHFRKKRIEPRGGENGFARWN